MARVGEDIHSFTPQRSSTSSTDEKGVIVVNPDGSSIGGGADGADVNAGSTTDAAIVTDANGTLSGKLRGLVKILADVWNSTAHWLVTSSGSLAAGEDLPKQVLGILMKPISSASYAPYSYADAGTVTKANILNATGSVFSVRVTNVNAAARYFQLHNKATAPAAGETAQQYFVVPAGSATVPGILQLDSSYFASSEFFAAGIGWAISTTMTTFTDSATANEHTVKVRYSP